MTTTFHYLDGHAYGTSWAQRDRADHIPPSDEMARLESETHTESRQLRAFYLGALRGYREVVRTLRGGRWGT